MYDSETFAARPDVGWRSQIPQRVGRFADGFIRREDGTFVVFGVYVFLIILMFAGIGIDLMRYERDRAELQYTLDRAVLAAADLDQDLDPQSVVQDYFNKAGLGDYLADVTVNEGLGYRVVSANASSDMSTQFMHMTGVETLTVPAASTAEERIDGVEISLVLDVSGSMNSNSRLYNLKIAARDFIDQMVDNSEEDKLSISIVPYATQVSLPDDMMDEFNVTNEHSYSNCINFEGSAFNTTSVSTVAELERTMHFDPWYDWDGRDNDPEELIGMDDGYNSSLPVCEAMANREILPLSKDRQELKDYITALTARGNTSIDLGMKWGTALLDPSLQGPVDGMIADGKIDVAFDARPHDYDDGETLKVIVLMTDGQNTSQYYIEDDFRRGDSNIWWNTQEEEYSVYVGLDTDDEDNDDNTLEPLFYWPFNNTWNDHAYGEGTFEETTYENTDECISYRRSGSCRRYATVATTVTVDEPGEAEILTYGDLYAYTTLEWIVEDLYEPWMNDSDAWNDWYYAVRSYVGSSTKDTRTRAICEEAKDENIIVFTIGFEAPSRGQEVLEDCASSPAHYFDVDGLEITDAFSSIASSIRKLRLTQ
ncbi:pilus assembly protein [Falsiphaeobacter marinintestinus]|uniref:pilus assembly protein n=1 Tax=Falsiphaeobacter marinintestinus TaxID=1492905 RepID=UPI0011B70424|nr:pilus assembly protein [Phaeobacter marinintestinus]